MDIRVKSIFGEWAEQLQVMVDTNLDALKQPVFNRYFTMGTPTMSLDYATAVGRSRIEAAASVVAHGSEAPLRIRAGLDKYSGEVASIKVKRKMDEADYRNYLVMQKMDMANSASIIKLIWDDVKYVVDSVNARLDYMCIQALSKGVISLSTTTNPDGIVPGDIDLLVTNKLATDAAFLGTTGSTRTWTAANKTTATIIQDIETVSRNALNTYGIKLGKILMTSEKLWIILNNDEVQSHLKGAGGIVSGQDARFSLANLNGLLASLSLPVIELVDTRIAIESDGVRTVSNPWPDKKYVTFAPDGQLGIIHNAYAIEQVTPVQGVDYATANSVLVSKWAQTEPFGEFTRGEIAAFPGLEAADQLYMINTEHQTTF